MELNWWSQWVFVVKRKPLLTKLSRFPYSQFMSKLLPPQQAFEEWNYLSCRFGDETARYLQDQGIESEILSAQSPQGRFLVVDKTKEKSNALIFAHTEPFIDFYNVQQATPRSVYVSRNWQHVPYLADQSLSNVTWRLELNEPEFFMNTENSTPSKWTQDKADIFAKVFGIKPSADEALHRGLIQALEKDNAVCAYGNAPDQVVD